jgi:hypothetical protein
MRGEVLLRNTFVRFQSSVENRQEVRIRGGCGGVSGHCGEEGIVGDGMIQRGDRCSRYHTDRPFHPNSQAAMPASTVTGH